LSRLQATSFGCPSLKPTSPPPSSSPLCLSESLQGGCVLCRPLALSSRTSFFFQTQHFLFLCLWCSLNTRRCLPVSTQCCMFLYPPGILSGWPSGPSASRFGSVLCDWLPPPSSAATTAGLNLSSPQNGYIFVCTWLSPPHSPLRLRNSGSVPRLLSEGGLPHLLQN
jgi:hypothetical protein